MNLSGISEINDDFKSLLKHFSTVNHVYIKYFDESDELLYTPEYSDEVRTFIKQYIDSEKEQIIINSFIDESPETLIEGETFCPFMRLQAVCIRDSANRITRKASIIGIISAKVPSDTVLPPDIFVTNDRDFEQVGVLFSELTSYYFKEVYKNSGLQDEIKKLEDESEELKNSARRNEALAEILKGLETEKYFIDAAEDVLKSAGEYLSVSNAFLLEKRSDSNMVFMPTEWSVSEEIALLPIFDHVELKTLPFLTDRPYTISSDSVLPDKFKTFFERFNITAGIFLPLVTGVENIFYICFVNIRSPRRFTVPDLQFAEDVRQVLKTIYTKRNSEQSLKSSYSSLESILANSSCGEVVFDSVYKMILYSNEPYDSMFYNDNDRRAISRFLYEHALNEEKSEFYAEDAEKYFSIHFANIKWHDGRDVYLGTVTDITGMKNYEKKIFVESNSDYVTGLYNKHKFDIDIENEIKDAVRSGDDGALLLIDLDDFKAINEGLGTKNSESLLKEVGEALRLICGKRAYAYNISGDEFAIILPSIYKDVLPRLVSALEKRFNRAWQIGDAQYYCTMCMGVSRFPKDGDTPADIFQHTDFALRVAKKRGKSQTEYYNPHMDAFSKRRLEIESAMHEAVAKNIDEFVVYYQPLIDANRVDRHCVGAEALVRWNSPTLGFVYPDEFIPVAEYLGLIVQIGDHVLEEATKKCRYWNDYGHPEFRINVNFSMIQLMQKDIVATIKKALSVSGLNPGNLVLEVTESIAEKDTNYLAETLQEIRKLGVRISLDDFGTGYSSFARLKDMPLDEVKIDKSFVTGIGEDDFSDSFVKNISDMASDANMDVIVEGVETKAQKEKLRDMNVDIIQGYLYDKPLKVEEFEKKYLN